MTKAKTAEDFKNKAKEMNIGLWPLSTCLLCNSTTGFVFIEDRVYYHLHDKDSCTLSTDTEVSFQAIADFYNYQRKQKTVHNMNEFWGFSDV